MEERLRKEGHELLSAFAAWKYPNKHFIYQRPVPEKTHSRYFVDGTVPRLDSWSAEKLEPWLCVPTQELCEFSESTIRLTISADGETRVKVAAGMRRRLIGTPKLRGQHVTWALTDPQRNLALDQRLTQALDWLWAGMRSLPYSEVDLAEAVGSCVALHQLGFNPNISVQQAKYSAPRTVVTHKDSLRAKRFRVPCVATSLLGSCPSTWMRCRTMCTFFFKQYSLPSEYSSFKS
jgi:hypothetical protein